MKYYCEIMSCSIIQYYDKKSVKYAKKWQLRNLNTVATCTVEKFNTMFLLPDLCDSFFLSFSSVFCALKDSN